MDLRSKKETYLLHNDLTCLALGLVGQVTTIDLRNEASVTGLVEQVDGYMNILMSNVIYVDGDNSQHLFDDFFIKARNVRYIHIPDDVQVIPTIHNQLRILHGKGGEGKHEKPKRTFRQSRLQRQQEETLRLVEEEKRKKSEMKKSQ
ncbi:U7 snRNA-associated Sm-like protein LSm10 [Hetaerina americana]|uniref:U7 snRNA-associated Sm-like protein LSm10 n=1 Tax=Hetaerina americana TaxID=62018 RepID=UPI003A7F4E67